MGKYCDPQGAELLIFIKDVRLKKALVEAFTYRRALRRIARRMSQKGLTPESMIKAHPDLAPFAKRAHKVLSREASFRQHRKRRLLETLSAQDPKALGLTPPPVAKTTRPRWRADDMEDISKLYHPGS